MPTYEYSCDHCGTFEQFHSISTTLTKCPKCGGPVRRLISQNSNIIFKGSGFYSTDYRKSSTSGSSTSSTSTSSSSAGSKAS